ncbi:YjjG family noncanonical pyrimidine nucleotidase [Paenibacillus sp. UMB4589-SE434]|uniref:YjjG family noncanonical pyrimidine nucleotidase n=1 Tax=Paenibacillus sp. UMB4589-SE434 TaxID=3046314 RepID=UPI00254EEFC3|nr:YjjG family noncanonical pyrimidine nucleotidase [Paenibacillus sp. UMB4589-SE434]MDK8179953.1 YjjG family noncanonical pyrimidine nucleotidase [Paenibacillus sp. UMB4589-SE434]
MQKYKTLLFDVDDTLLDFGAAEKLALEMLFKGEQALLTPEIEANYKKINHALWKSFEEGKLDRDEVVNTRFSILFKQYGKDVDGTVLENNYRTYLEQGHQLVNGAFDLIMDLHQKYDLYIVSNGVSKTQYKRLRDSGLYPMFKDIFVSEDTGFQKPMKEYFDYVFARIPNFAAEQTLIVGDSLSADIKGGHLAGIDTCWFNPEMIPNHSDIIATYQIQKLVELYPILTENNNSIFSQSLCTQA